MIHQYKGSQNTILASIPRAQENYFEKMFVPLYLLHYYYNSQDLEISHVPKNR